MNQVDKELMQEKGILTENEKADEYEIQKAAMKEAVFFLAAMLEKNLDMSELQTISLYLKELSMKQHYMHIHLYVQQLYRNSRPHNVQAIMNGLLYNRDLKFEVHRERPKNPYVLADVTRIREVLVNLLGNAVKFTKDGGKITLDVSSYPGADEKHIITRYVVRDNGIGMSEEFQKKLFDPFSQEDDANARTQYKGTGLGMAITKKYVDMMGGSIAVESKKGVGSTFTVEIPLELTEQVIPSEQKQHLHRDLTGIHVLMAEDNDLNAELATIILEDAGMTVTRASDGKEVVNLFENHPRGTYDFILMDIMMPNMDGHQAAKAIRALGVERSDAVTIPIIALSANAFIDDIQESLDSGMNDHISKPINMEELIDTITKYIKHY